ncbi:Chromobox protein [Trichinella pseudospiralis]
MVEENGDVFMAECIMNERVRNGKKEYLVRWEGYSEKYDSWEPAEHILGEELFAEFKKAKENAKLKRKVRRSYYEDRMRHQQKMLWRSYDKNIKVAI